MKLTVDAKVKHLTRVEGHGNIDIRIRDGVVERAQWEVVETPRFFEALLVGKHWENAPWITGRICGICSIGHTLASIRAVENAFGIEPSEQTRTLRLILKHMETLQSHVLHLYFLVAPDFLGHGSVLPLIQSAPDVVKRAAGLKELANDVCDAVGGRRLHPTRTVVGGFTALPDRVSLEKLRHRLRAAMGDLLVTADIFAGFALPEFTRETEYVSLVSEGSYPFIGGDIASTDGAHAHEHEYRRMTNEYVAEHSTSKWSRLSRKSFAVGALARVNNNYMRLHPAAREVAERFALKPVCHNPFMNNIAQLVECVHVAAETVDLMEHYLGMRPEAPSVPVAARPGTGVGAVEVPRGILYHSYAFDADGRITACDCVIPTSQNNANIHHDIEHLAATCAETGKGMTDPELEKLASMLVRAYDPCISCSVH